VPWDAGDAGSRDRSVAHLSAELMSVRRWALNAVPAAQRVYNADINCALLNSTT